MYYADARATVRGWTPSWYGTYRFVLTFIVGAAIVISLVGRGQIADRVGKLPGPMDESRPSEMKRRWLLLRKSILEWLNAPRRTRESILISNVLVLWRVQEH